MYENGEYVSHPTGDVGVKDIVLESASKGDRL